jgi:hypothetical protein
MEIQYSSVENTSPSQITFLRVFSDLCYHAAGSGVARRMEIYNCAFSSPHQNCIETCGSKEEDMILKELVLEKCI